MAGTGEAPINRDVPREADGYGMGEAVERALFRVLIEAPVLLMAKLVELGMPGERPINAEVEPPAPKTPAP